MKKLFLDLETTSLNTQTAGITQIAMSVMYTNGSRPVDPKAPMDFNQYLRVYAADDIQIGALKAQGITKEILETDEKYVDPGKGFWKVKSFLSQHVNPYNKRDKFTLYGYNVAAYDMPILRKYWGRNEDERYLGSFFYQQPVDIMIFAAEVLGEVRNQLPNLKQKTLANWLDIHIDDERLHSADYDVLLCMEIYERLVKRYKTGGL